VDNSKLPELPHTLFTVYSRKHLYCLYENYLHQLYVMILVFIVAEDSKLYSIHLSLFTILPISLSPSVNLVSCVVVLCG